MPPTGTSRLTTAVRVFALCASLTAGVAGCKPGAGRAGDVPYPTISPRPGMKAASLSHFGFGVPREWRQRGGSERNYWDDPAGRERLYADVFTGCGKRQRPDTRLPRFTSGDNEETPRVRATSRLRVAGAGGAWRYELGDAGSDRAAVNVWIPGCEKEIWLVVTADSGVVDKIASSIVAESGTKRGERQGDSG